MKNNMPCSCKKIKDCTTATEICEICKSCIMQREAKSENETDEGLFGEEQGMTEWKVTIILKSGEIVKGIYKSEKDNTTDVAREMLPECKPTNIFGFQSDGKNEVVFVVSSEIAAFKIGI